MADEVKRLKRPKRRKRLYLTLRLCVSARNNFALGIDQYKLWQKNLNFAP